MVKVVKIEDVPPVVPANHYHLVSHRILEALVGAKGLVVSFSRMEPNGRSDPHKHEDTTHVMIVLKGELGVKTNQGEVRVKPGEAIFIYPGELHGNSNASKGETEYFVITFNAVP